MRYTLNRRLSNVPRPNVLATAVATICALAIGSIALPVAGLSHRHVKADELTDDICESVTFGSTSPTDGTVINGPQYTVSATVNDPANCVSHVTYQASAWALACGPKVGVAGGELTKSSGNTYTGTLDTASLPTTISCATGQDQPVSYYIFRFEAKGTTETDAVVQVRNVTLGDVTAPNIPILLSPANGSTQPNGFDFVWSAATDPSGPVTYDWESSLDGVRNTDGSFTTPAARHNGLTATSINENFNGPSPAGTYFWHVRAIDAYGNASAWADPWTVTISNTI